MEGADKLQRMKGVTKIGQRMVLPRILKELEEFFRLGMDTEVLEKDVLYKEVWCSPRETTFLSFNASSRILDLN